MPPKAILNPDEFPQKVLVPIEEIRQLNLQRFEMEQLTAITWLDPENHRALGYKDLTDQEFWVRGHIPEFALMPGVLMCEAAAQLCSFYARRFQLVDGDFIGFGGMDSFRFRGMVRPGERLWIAAAARKISRRNLTCETQGFVNGKMVFNGEILGIALHTSSLSAMEAND